MRAVWLGFAMAAWLAGQSAGAPKWRIKYFHDTDETAIAFEDITFASPTVGMAVGTLVQTERRAQPRGVALITSDGGQRWAEVKLPDVPVSVFALDAGNVWLVGQNGVWKSAEFGREWKKLSSPKGALRVFFLNEKRGFAVGINKAVWQTEDGGVKWQKVPEAEAPKTQARYTAYTTVTFLNQRRGLIAGFSRPPRRTDQKVPAWMDPDGVSPDVPSITVTLETTDGGKNWSPSVVSSFGQVRRVVFGPKAGLALVEFGEGFPYPSEVNRLDYGGKTARVFREKNRAVQDAAFDAAGHGWLVAVERKGQLGHLPIPGRLCLYESTDLATWTERDVDYKAIANAAVFASGHPDARFVATDTGMILKLE